MEKAVFLGYNALGDTLCTTPVIRAFRRRHPETAIVYIVQNADFCRILDGNPDIDLVLYNEWLFAHGLTKFNCDWLYTLPLDLDRTAMLYRLDLQAVCTSYEAFQTHISHGFAQSLGMTIESTLPVVALNSRDRHAAGLFIARPYIVFSMCSVANPLRKDGLGLAKTWPDDRWSALARKLSAWGYDVLCVGSERDPRPPFSRVRNLYGLPIRVAAALLERAACLVTLENGVAHLAAALDVPTVLIYSEIVPLAWARHPEFQRCHVLYGDPAEVSVERVAGLVEDVLALQAA